MTANGAMHDPIAVERIPAWMGALAGTAVTRAEARAVGGRVIVRALTASGPTLWEFRDTPSLVCLRVDTRADPPRRFPASIPVTSAPDVERFVRRVAWLQNADGPHHVAPSDDEARLRALSDALFAMRTPDDAAAIPIDDADRTAPSRGPVALYVDACAGRWEHVFTATDADGSERFGSLALILTALSGDLDALRMAAARPSAEIGARALLEGATLALAGLHDASLARHRTAVECLSGRRRADAYLEMAKLSRERGALDAATDHARHALLARPDDDAHLLRCSRECVRCSAFDDAYAALAARCERKPFAPALALALAELLLRAGRTADARRWLATLDGDTGDLRKRRAEGVVLALEGRWEEARAAFERARVAAPDDMETLAWLAETSLRLGHREEAARLTTASRTRVQTAVHTLLAGALTPPERLANEHALWRLLDVLGESRAPWHTDPTQAALAVLDGFGGNRGEPLTRRIESAPGLGLAPLQLPRADSLLSSRDAAADALRAIDELPIPALEHRLETLAAVYPDSPHPLCFHGELDLWLGETKRAIRRFDAALARAPARWGYVGRAAAEILLGDWTAADATLAACDARFAPIPGATTHVYVGEMWRRRGDPARAIVELREAVTAKPGRIGAWINLALSLHAQGDDAEAQRIFGDVVIRAPRLLWDAARALGRPALWPPPPAELEPLFETALAMMRGNRSSHTVTYFDPEGRLRVVRPIAAWRALLANHAPTLGSALRSALTVGS